MARDQVGTQQADLFGIGHEAGAMTAGEGQASAKTQYYWPNKLGRIFLLSLEDVLGRNGLNAVLNQARLRHLIGNYPPNNLDLSWSFGDVAALSQALDDVHGEHRGRGLAVRAGRASFYHLLDDLGAVLGVGGAAFRLFPLSTRMKAGLNAISDTFNNTSDQVVRVEEGPDELLFHVDRCPVCWGRTADSAVCHAHLGLLQEGMHWFTGGRNIRVDEILCIAKGDPCCTYVVVRHPLER